jgi:death-on-curing protein
MPGILPEWLEKRDVVHFQRLLHEEHGGLHGIRDEGALESTLARPQQLLHYQADATIFELAASYGHGFAKNHVFLDGNKRISLTSIDIFLQLNGFQLEAEEVDAVLTIRDVASGALNESELATWIKENSDRFDLDGI